MEKLNQLTVNRGAMKLWNEKRAEAEKKALDKFYSLRQLLKPKKP